MGTNTGFDSLGPIYLRWSDLIIRKQQDMKIKLGREDHRTIVVARSDGGCSISPSRRSQCSYPVIAVEVTVFVFFVVDIRLNE